MSNETRNHKDNVFCMLYRDKGNLLSLYNAVNGTYYEDENALEVVTLEGAICMKIKNDAAFVVDSKLNLYEQQATPNPNMPLRDLYYVAEELKKIAPPKRLYRNTKVQIPSPRFIVFYNGAAEQPEKQMYKLSDMFAGEEKDPELELKVTVFNINRGNNRELLKKCESLRGYMTFVEKVRVKRAAGLSVEKAVSEAIEECISEGILADFFVRYKEEVMEVSIWEFNQELHDQAMREDGEVIGFEKGKTVGYEEGKNQGIAQGKIEGIAQGKIEGIAQGIIDLGSEVGLPESEILYKLQNKLNISKEKVQEYYKMFGLPTV